MDNRPIGIFDSGLGGLSVWREIIKVAPDENIIYLADSGHCPYGQKSDEEIKNLAFSCTRFLLSADCKLIVVACNTATAAAIDSLRSSFKVPFIGMEPAVKPAALNSKTGHVGILATQGTFNGRLYKETSKKFAKGIELHVQVGYGLVELVEKGMANSDEAAVVLKNFINPMIEKKIDHLVLGCTHYPFLEKKIREITGNKVILLDPAPAVAKRTNDVLIDLKFKKIRQSKPFWKFYTTGEPAILKNFLFSELKINANPEKIVLDYEPNTI